VCQRAVIEQLELLAMEGGGGAQGSVRVGDESASGRPTTTNPAPKRGGVKKAILKLCCFCCASSSA
jgi:hypothetical protein